MTDASNRTPRPVASVARRTRLATASVRALGAIAAAALTLGAASTGAQTTTVVSGGDPVGGAICPGTTTFVDRFGFTVTGTADTVNTLAFQGLGIDAPLASIRAPRRHGGCALAGADRHAARRPVPLRLAGARRAGRHDLLPAVRHGPRPLDPRRGRAPDRPHRPVLHVRQRSGRRGGRVEPLHGGQPPPAGGRGALGDAGQLQGRPRVVQPDSTRDSRRCSCSAGRPPRRSRRRSPAARRSLRRGARPPAGASSCTPAAPRRARPPSSPTPPSRTT